MKRESKLDPKPLLAPSDVAMQQKHLVGRVEMLPGCLDKVSVEDVGVSFFSSAALNEALKTSGWTLLKHVQLLVGIIENEKAPTNERRSSAREIRALIRDNMIVEGRMQEVTSRAEMDAQSGKIVIESTGLRLIQDAGKATELALRPLPVLEEETNHGDGTRRNTVDEAGSTDSGGTPSSGIQSESGVPGRGSDAAGAAGGAGPSGGSTGSDAVEYVGPPTPGERRRRRVAAARGRDRTTSTAPGGLASPGGPTTEGAEESEEAHPKGAGPKSSFAEDDCDDIGGSLPEGYTAGDGADDAEAEEGEAEDGQHVGHIPPKTTGGHIGICATPDG